MYSTKESAEQAVLKDLVRDETEKKYIYAYQDEQWVLKSVYWRNPYLNNGMWQEDVKFSPQASFIVNCPVELYF